MNKEEKTKKKSKKTISGITLIALVITIIVLLILAGVSIATLTGQNGILTRANNAKGRTEEEEARERAKMLVASSFDENGYFDLDIFKKELEKEGGSIVTEDEDQIVVQIGDYEVTIDIVTGKIENFQSSKGVIPKISTKFYTESGEELQEDKSYEKVIVTVFIDNQDEIDKIDSVTVLDAEGSEITKEASVTGDGGYASYKVSVGGSITITVKATTDGVQKTATKKVTVVIAPEQWEVTSETDKEWYDFGENTKICGPNLLGEMTPIKYIGEEIDANQNKWANAMTKDGSMFVWIPRFAYRITEGYNTDTAGTIEVAFIDKENKFINNDSDGKPITTNPSEENAGTEAKWLVHPAFTSDASIGGGFGEAGKGIEGFWVGKFEATGTYDKTSETGTLSVKPGEKALGNMTINQQFKLAKSSQFGESASAEELGSHMAKNSEWGAVAYLTHSKYGAKDEETGECGQQIAKNTNSSDITGGNTDKIKIYTDNKKQSTTYNATGVYDMVGGSYEYVASYGNFTSSSYLTTNGGNQEGDLCDTATRGESTAYKTVYGTSYSSSQSMKGDAIYETSGSEGTTDSWFGACARFPYSTNPFFERGGYWSSSNAGTFCFSSDSGKGVGTYSFRVCLVEGGSL